MRIRLPSQHLFTRLGAWLARLWTSFRGGPQASAESAAAVGSCPPGPPTSTFWYDPDGHRADPRHCTTLAYSARPLPVSAVTTCVYDGETGRLLQVIDAPAPAGDPPH
jgi:hypothetical protein